MRVLAHGKRVPSSGHQASFTEDETLAWRPAKASNFMISYFFYLYVISFSCHMVFTNRAKLPYLCLIFEASFGTLQPARMADSKSPEYHTLMFGVIALQTLTASSC